MKPPLKTHQIAALRAVSAQPGELPSALHMAIWPEPPGRNDRPSNQGAGLAVAAVMARLIKDGLVAHHYRRVWGGHVRCGYKLTQAGRDALAAADGSVTP